MYYTGQLNQRKAKTYTLCNNLVTVTTLLCCQVQQVQPVGHFDYRQDLT